MADVSLPDAWERWDQQPSSLPRVEQLLAAESAAAELLGLTHMQVHDQLCAGRRAGLSYEQAIDALRADHEPTGP